ESGAVRSDDVDEGSTVAPSRHDRFELEPPAAASEGPCDRRDRAPGEQHAALRLEDREGDPVGRDLRPASADIVDGQPLDRHRLLAEDAFRGRLEAILAMGEPGDADLEHERVGRLVAERPPRVTRLACPARVKAIGAVRRANDPRLVAGRRSRMPGAIRVDEEDLAARAGGPKCGPGAHRPGAHDDEVGHGSNVTVAATTLSTAFAKNSSGT